MCQCFVFRSGILFNFFICWIFMFFNTHFSTHMNITMTNLTIRHLTWVRSRMVKTQPETTKKQVCNELKLLEDRCVHSQACFASAWAERLSCKKEALAHVVAPWSSNEVCCWSHGKRKKLLKENSLVIWNKNVVVWPQWTAICLLERRRGLQP